jgi:hypothetical protein
MATTQQPRQQQWQHQHPWQQQQRMLIGEAILLLLCMPAEDTTRLATHANDISSFGNKPKQPKAVTGQQSQWLSAAPAARL